MINFSTNFSTNSVFDFGRSCFASPLKSTKVATKVVGVFLIATYALAKARSPALKYACYFGWNKLAKALILAKTNVNSPSYFENMTPLHVAALVGNSCMVRLLIDAGADPSIGGGKDFKTGRKCNDSPIRFAVKSCDLETLKILHPYNSIELYHLYSAIRKGNIEVVDWILTDCISSLGQSREACCEIALYWACKAGNEELVRLLVNKYKTNVNAVISEEIAAAVDKYVTYWNDNLAGYSPIHIAARCGRKNIMKLLVDFGAQIDLKTKDGEGETIVHLACQFKKKEVLEYLTPYFQNGKLNINEMNSKGQTPLNILESSSNSDKKEELLSYFSDHVKAEIDSASG